MPIRDLIFTGIFVACLPACFFRPFWGVIMWTIVALLNPHAFMWQVRSEFPWAMAVAIPTLAGFLVFSFNAAMLLSREVYLMALLWVWFTVTTLCNTHVPEFAHFSDDTWMRWGMVSKILVMTLVTIGIVTTWERFRLLLLTIAGCLGFLVAKAVPFMIATGGTFRLYGPPGSMIADNNDFGLALNMTLPMFFFMARRDPDRRIRRVMAFLFCATIPGILFTYSRGALLGLAAVMLFMIMRLPQRVLLIPILLAGGLFAALFTPEQWQQRMDFRREGALIDDSALSRFNAWTYCWKLVQEYPLMGGGFEAFTPELFDRFAPNSKDVHGPHSVYFGVLAEHGFPGLALYLTLVLSSFAALTAVVRKARAIDSEELADYANMLRMSLIGFLITGAFLGRAYFDYYFTIIACVVILKRLAGELEIGDDTVIYEQQEQMA